MKQKLRLFTSLLLLAVASVAWGEEVTWSGKTALPGTATSIGESPIQIKTSSTNNYTNPIRIYANTTVTITAAEGYVIQSVTYEASSTGEYVTNAQNADVNPQVTPTVSSKNVTWSYGANSSVTEFTFKPKAQTRANSISVTYKSTGEAAETYTVTLGDDNTQLTEAFGGVGVTLPTRDDQGVFEFQGWSDSNLETETTTAPTIIPAGNYKPSADITLYPIYKRTETVGGEGSTASVTVEDYATANNWKNQTQYKTINLDANVVVTASEGSNTGKYYSNDHSWRFYSSENATLTFTSNTDEINSITLTYSEGAFKYGNSQLTSGEAITVSGKSVTINCTIKAFVNAISVTYGGGSTAYYYTSNPVETTVANPVIELASSYIGSTTATITCATAGSTILYSFDNNNWNTYSEPVEITTSATIYAKATKTGLADSEVVSASTTRMLATPTISPNGGNFMAAQQITITAEEDASIYYTTDGSEPTTKSTPYSSAFTLSQNCTLKAKAFMDEYTSEVASAEFAFVIIEDGVFDFEGDFSDYGSGINKTSDGQYYETESSTWKAGSVTLVASGKYRRWSDATLRFYSNDPASAMTFSVPDGKVIKSIDITGSTAFTANVGTYSNGKWTGQSQTVVLTMNGKNSLTVKKVVVTYAETIPVTISAAGYSTLYYGTKNLTVPENMEAYTVKVTTKVERSTTYNADDVIPAGTGVVLKAAEGTYEFTVVAEAGEKDANNMLHGNDEKATTTGGTYYYALTLNADNDPNSAGFYWMKKDGAAYEAGAHKAYLALDKTFAELAGNGNAKGFLALPDNETDGIRQIENGQTAIDNAEIYNLSGQRVNKAQKGIYIVNGKKVVIR